MGSGSPLEFGILGAVVYIWWNVPRIARTNPPQFGESNGLTIKPSPSDVPRPLTRCFECAQVALISICFLDVFAHMCGYQLGSCSAPR